jgi:glycosyltransferase involved in cell wall biosynthesis
VKKPVLSIFVLTYNHEKYVSQTLDSIINQEHTYPYEIVIGDDLSTDNTRNILLAYKKKYPGIIKLLLNEKNQGLIKNYYNTIRSCNGKYIMGCAGDDYWLPGKVSLQINFMERNNKYGMCYTRCNIISDGKYVETMGGPKTDFNSIIKLNCIPAPTVVFKRELIFQYISDINPETKDWMMEDFPFWLYLSLKSTICFLNSTTAVYRIVCNSITHDLNLLKSLKFELSVISVQSFFYKYAKLEYDKNIHIDNLYRRYIKRAILNLDALFIKKIFTTIQKPTQNDKLLFLGRYKPICFLLNRFFFLKQNSNFFRKSYYLLKWIIKNIYIIFSILMTYSQILFLRFEKGEIIARIDGGLSSQMLQYIIGQEIQRITGKRVSYDLSWYNDGAKDILGIENRFYELERVFPHLIVKKANKEKINIYKRLFNKQTPGILVQNLDTLNLSKTPIYLGGYWESKKYSSFDLDKLRDTFSFTLKLDAANRQMLNKIHAQDCSVAVQIRLGDYLGSVHDIITPEYFDNAINYVIKNVFPANPHFFIFTNDHKKSKVFITQQNSVSIQQITFVNINDNDHGAYDMYLMTQCHHFIISNSGFGYFPALLSVRSKNKIVVQPDKWYKTDSKKIAAKYPGWIVMNTH